jgi:leader peptidase (prepilin peptidase) / N-methyltransferase
MPELVWISAQDMSENWHLLIVVLVFGLCVGSFLNVVIYRLPMIMEQGSKLAYNEYIAEQGIAGQPLNVKPRITLSTPASSCRQCGHLIRWYENIPLISWLVLRGKCSACGTPIGMRYPLVELMHGLLWLCIAWRYGITPIGVGYMLLASALFALFWIDWDTQYLPDHITLPLLWAGLIFNVFVRQVSLQDAILGAVAGYLLLWTIYHLYMLVRKQEGMGFGDFKLMSALGAWFGIMALPPLILASSLGGSVFGISMILLGKLGMQQKFAFGPFIAIAGLAAIFMRPERWLSAVL